MTLTTDQKPTTPPPWGIPATIAWVLLAFLISIIVAAGAYAVWQADESRPSNVTYDGVLIAVGTLVSIPVQIAVLAFAAQLRRWHPMDYLGLNSPRRGEVIFGALCVIALDIVFNTLLYVTGHDIVGPFQMEAYQSAKDAGWLLWLLIAIVVVAPVGEEIAFRGFLYRGLALPGREIYAIVAIAIAWALLHIQYDWLGMVQIFLIGIMFGWFRWASGSTTLTIAMHVLVNFEAMVETVIKLEVLS